MPGLAVCRLPYGDEAANQTGAQRSGSGLERRSDGNKCATPMLVTFRFSQTKSKPSASGFDLERRGKGAA